QAVVFTDAPHLDAAKDFLTYLTEPTVLSDFLKTSYGRYMPPAQSQIQADSFWQDPADPHVSTVVKTVLDEQVQPFQNVYNPAYGIVMEQNVWGNAIDQIVTNGVSAEEAAEEAIADIKTIFADRS
ncbi:MAG: carbohydrate ABC transporter substrate-binding protein, partial [Cyanobacteria bacterium J06632_3]